MRPASQSQQSPFDLPADPRSRRANAWLQGLAGNRPARQTGELPAAWSAELATGERESEPGSPVFWFTEEESPRPISFLSLVVHLLAFIFINKFPDF